MDTPDRLKWLKTAATWAFGGDRKWFVLVTGLAAADAAGGFWLSFTNLTGAAAQHGWQPPWMLPLIIDLGIPVYVVADHWLVARGHRSPLARGATWAFAAATVILNGAVSTDPEPLWRWAHMLAPATWILGVEVVRRMWKAYRKGQQPTRDRIPFARWIAAPVRTPRLWRRKHELSVTWTAVLALEDARLFVEALADAARSARPDETLPATIERVVDTCRFPAVLAEKVTTVGATEWEPVLIDWVGLQMALPAVLLAAVSAATPDPLPVPPVQEVPVTPLTGGTQNPLTNGHRPPLPGPLAAPSATPLLEGARNGSRTPPSREARAPRPDSSRDLRHGRDMSTEEIAAFVREHLPAVPVPSINQIFALGGEKLASGYGRPKAQAAHKILEDTRVGLVADSRRG